MRIKEECEDFIVREIPLESFSDEPSSYHVYLLKKRNYTTQRALAQLSRSLRIPSKRISFAGTKDKQAITYQYISIQGVKKEKVASLALKDIELEFVGYREEPFHLGGLIGNTFEILVKDVTLVNTPTMFFVPNYFDEQRFSTANVRIGKAILKKEYKEAIDIILSQDKDYQEQIQTHLSKQQHDYVGALRILPRKILLFYVHAVQSYIFNEQLAQRMRDIGNYKEVTYSEGVFAFPEQLLVDVEQEEAELIGFDSLQGYGGIEPSDFINKSLPELSLEGAQRPLFSKVDACSLNQEEDGVVARFQLGKGSYATIVLKQLFS